MRSLRVQLLLGTALGTTAVLLVSAAVLYALIRRTLWAEFDESLAAKARSLMALAEQEEDGLEFELTEVSLPEFEPSEHAEYYQVWLPNGAVFARSPSLLDGDLARIAGTSDAPAFQTVQLPDGRPGRIVGATFVPRGDRDHLSSDSPIVVTLAVGRGIAGLQATLARVRGTLICVCVVAVMLSAGLLAWVVRRSLKPVDHLSRQIEDVGEDDLSARVDAVGIPRELSPVVERLNELLARLDATFQRERRFTGDVAHELRTPLAGLRSKLELALSCERAPEAYRRAMGDCLKISLQMQRMVENLLHLARADAGQLEVRCQRVNLTEVIRDCWKPMEEKARSRGLSVKWHLNDTGMTETDRDKLCLVIQNILDNAVTYANDRGHVSVLLSAEDGMLALTVSNTVGSLPVGDTHRVFDRFWRADSSQRQTDEGHCGLGLPLCKSLIEHLGGSIEAATNDGGMFTITTRLPRVGTDKRDRQPATRPAQD
jgi:two-component system heavy metal sensor histidine kinase CusS